MKYSLVASALLVTIAVAATACTIGGPSYETIELPMHTQEGAKTCGSAFIKADLSKLEACGEGQGHCYPSNKVAIPELPACKNAGDVCVPDSVLVAGGQKAKSCTFYINGKPGACTSTLVRDVGSHKDQLHQERCAGDERCVPCISPADQSDTHLCDDLGVHGEACEAGTAQEALAPCCHYSGVCMDKEAVPEGSRDNMSRNSCSDGKLCAPAALTNGAPVKCNVLGADGVCIDLCFAAMLGGSAPVMRAGCGPTELCLPCAIGKGQGMPGCN